MAKQRVVNTKYWKDGYIRSLDRDGKLLFIYLFTNDRTEICGAYEITVDEIQFDTGLPLEKINELLAKFNKDKKYIYRNGWLLCVNFIKNQRPNRSVLAGIRNSLERVPRWCGDRLSQTIRNLNLNLNPNLKEKEDGPDAPTDPGGQPPLREIFLGTVEAGLAARMGIKTLPNRRDWHQRLLWAFDNDFTPEAVLETYDLMKKGFWLNKSVSAKSLVDNIPNRDALRAELANKGNGHRPVDDLPDGEMLYAN